ncbi:UNVERIFIED_CONTAM: putative recombination initiation defects 3 [Sesamum angustifolium]|uniref:Recombination initiation defects 3 n=1 Tax=Sesamum angustifolium TaxID=2727405 RepID=A0AAW2RHK3_9LAMI
MVSSGLESSSIFPRSQVASQLRPQQPQQSQLTLSQGVSSQHGLFSQFSQNSQDEILTNEKIGSQERENSARRSSCLPPMSYTREESQMVVSRTSNNLMRKWSSQENKCQVSEELERRIGMIETSLSRFSMILDSIQSDIMQVNKATKEVALEIRDIFSSSCSAEGVRQKLIGHDDSLQSMAISRSTTIPKQKQATPPMHGPKAVSYHAPPQEVQFRSDVPRPLIAQQTSLLPKVTMGGWTSVKQEGAGAKVGNLSKRSNQIKISPNQLECRVVIESDEELDGCFSCLVKEKGTEKDEYSIKEAKEETARILRKARRRKRKYCDTIIIN